MGNTSERVTVIAGALSDLLPALRPRTIDRSVIEHAVLHEAVGCLVPHPLVFLGRESVHQVPDFFTIKKLLQFVCQWLFPPLVSFLPRGPAAGSDSSAARHLPLVRPFLSALLKCNVHAISVSHHSPKSALRDFRGDLTRATEHTSGQRGVSRPGACLRSVRASEFAPATFRRGDRSR